MYSDQLLLAVRKVHVVYLAQFLGAVHYIHFIPNHDTELSVILMRTVMIQLALYRNICKEI